MKQEIDCPVCLLPCERSIHAATLSLRERGRQYWRRVLNAPIIPVPGPKGTQVASAAKSRAPEKKQGKAWRELNSAVFTQPKDNQCETSYDQQS